MINPNVSQQDVINWFNKTYQRKGEHYLRPLSAYYIFLELLDAQPGQPLLDVACGLGRLLEAGQAYGCQLSGVDISEVAVQKARQKLPSAGIELANAEHLPFNNSSSELITCLGSLERMLDLEKVLAELYRVGTPDAKYCFLVRNANTLGWKLFKQKLGLRNKQGHQGAKSLTEWKNIFSKRGFEVEAIYPDQYPLQKRRRWFSLGLANVDVRQVISSKQPLENANEFIFLLTKADK